MENTIIVPVPYDGISGTNMTNANNTSGINGSYNQGEHVGAVRVTWDSESGITGCGSFGYILEAGKISSPDDVKSYLDLHPESSYYSLIENYIYRIMTDPNKPQNAWGDFYDALGPEGYGCVTVVAP